MLTYRIWYVDSKATSLCDHRKSELRPILLIIIDAGAIYSFTLFAALIYYVKKSNGQYLVVDMVSHRVLLANKNNPTEMLLLAARSRPLFPSRFTWSSSVSGWLIGRTTRCIRTWDMLPLSTVSLGTAGAECNSTSPH